ncbi:MAG: hypothetical protein U0892_05910 [Pirellulales bacterium]
MPLHDVGYRAWPHTRALEASRWWVLALTGIALVWRGTWLKRSLSLTWIPALFAAGAFALYEQSISRPELRQGVAQLVRMADGPRSLAENISADPEQSRHTVWSLLLLAYLRQPQMHIIVLLVGLIAPRLISYDIRTRGYLLYFSRPIKVVDYVLGKSFVLWFYLFMVTALPALILYVIGLLISPDPTLFGSTWDLPLRVLAASCVMIIPTSAVALAFSSMTVESRYASFAWFASWAVGWTTYLMLTFVENATLHPDRPRRRGRDFEWPTRWEYVSPYHVLGRVEQWVFGLTPPDINIVLHMVLLASVTTIALAIVFYRVRRVSQM